MTLCAVSSVVPSLFALSFVASFGCLGRTGLNADTPDPLSVNGAPNPTGDSGAIADGPIASEAAPRPDSDVPPDSSRPPPQDDAGDDAPNPDDVGAEAIDIFDVFPIPESGPIAACANCVKDNCGSQVNACINSPSCVKGLGCTVSKCLGGMGGGGGGGGLGGLDFTCVLGCFGGDFGAAGVAIGAFTCVTGSCASACAGGLGGGDGGIPGLPGTDAGAGGGGGTPGGPGGMIPGVAWTAEQVRGLDLSTHFPMSSDAFDAWRPQLEATDVCAAK